MKKKDISMEHFTIVLLKLMKQRCILYTGLILSLFRMPLKRGISDIV